LFSTVHHLLISLFSTSLNVSERPAQLFTLFHVSIFPALEQQQQVQQSNGVNRGGDEAKARLADTLLDVIWQIDQEVDSGALEFRQAGGVFDTKKLADLGQAGRKRLAQFLKSLVVSSPSSISSIVTELN
jgi:hypothetical protein